MEKRFTIAIDSNDRKSLWDEQRTEEEPLICLDRYDEICGIDDCCNLLNELNDENEQLKHDATVLIQANQDYRKENEELKQFKEKVFVLLDEKIKHYGHKPFSAPVGQPMSVNFDADMDRLARLSELQDLEKELKK